MVKHLVIPGMTPELFTRWLALFDATCCELFDDAVRAAFHVKAERIAESLKLALGQVIEKLQRRLTAASTAALMLRKVPSVRQYIRQ